jgi:hypothetical protein
LLLVLLIALLLILCAACCLGEEKGWQEQLERGECMVQQLNESMYMLLNFAVKVCLGYVYGATPPRAL